MRAFKPQNKEIMFPLRVEVTLKHFSDKEQIQLVIQDSDFVFPHIPNKK